MEDDEYATYVWADSSEQADYDILMSTLLFIKVQDLATVFSLAKELALLQIDVKQMEANTWEDGDWILRRRSELGLLLQAFLTISIAIPIMMGKGKGSVEHNLHGLLHYWYLLMREPRIFNLKLFVRSVVSFTTDLGTESAIPNYCVKSHTNTEDRSNTKKKT